MPGLPEDLRHDLLSARQARQWSQAELGRRVGLPQVHISAIENGKVSPRYNTLLDLVRVLDLDLLLVPRWVVPAVHALIRDVRQGGAGGQHERPLYGAEDPEAPHGE